MVEHTLSTPLDSIFSSLADPTRRDIIRRIATQELSVGQIAKAYSLTFAAVSKHLKVLERAKLVIKQRRGNSQVVHLAPQTLAEADNYLAQYRQMWQGRLDSLENYLNEGQ